jgi:hypothetical protein
MHKALLDRFINKYSLGDNVTSVVWDVKDDVLSVSFVTSDKTLLGNVVLENFQHEDSTLGIYDTTQLTKLLGVLSDDIEFTTTTAGDKVIAVQVKDGNASVNYMLSDLSVIPTPPKMKELPDFELEVELNKTFMSRFINGKNALPEIETFSVISDGVERCNFVINYSSINTNRVTLPVDVKKSTSDMDLLSFNADLFSKVLGANRECEKGVMTISSAGLAKVEFKVDDYTAVYYLVAVQSVD